MNYLHQSKFLVTIQVVGDINASKIKLCKAVPFLNKRNVWLPDYVIFGLKKKNKIENYKLLHLLDLIKANAFNER